MLRRRRSDWFAPPLPRIIAHRGLTTAPDGGAPVPENTLAAFRRAIAAGADHLETDARATADGIAVLAHDPDLDRVAGRGVLVAGATLDELRAIDLGGGERICTLDELLAALPDVPLNLDVKAPDAVAPVVAAIRAAGAEGRVLVTSFSARRRRAAVAGLPGIATSASAGGAAAAVIGARLGIRPLVRLAVRGVDAVQIPPRYGPFSTATPSMIRRLHRSGIEVHYWTVNDPAAMRTLVASGADGIITDRTDLAVAALAHGL